ncbi:MAG: DUF2530 domain-containing protein [Actinomycetota bacterium]|nr:DUF2530 domain-containing protein [Actinomycetota bacterium]
MSDLPARMESPPSPGAEGGPRPVNVSVPTVCIVGSALWTVVLVVTLFVPALREGQRSWWPWTAVVGVALGVGCWFYVRRGRGNAAGV